MHTHALSLSALQALIIPPLLAFVFSCVSFPLMTSHPQKSHIHPLGHCSCLFLDILGPQFSIDINLTTVPDVGLCSLAQRNDDSFFGFQLHSCPCLSFVSLPDPHVRTLPLGNNLQQFSDPFPVSKLIAWNPTPRMWIIFIRVHYLTFPHVDVYLPFCIPLSTLLQLCLLRQSISLPSKF